METKKFTKKESLLIKLYETKNEFTQFTGNGSRYDIEKMSEYQIPNMAQKMTAAEIENEIRIAESCLENAKREASRREYLESEEGKAALAAIKEKKDNLFSKYQSLKSNTMIELTELLSGTGFSIKCFGDRSAELSTGTHQFNSIDIYYDNYRFFNEGPCFEVSVGSTGSFETDSDRAKFYIALGQFLSNPNIENIKTLLLGYNEKYNELSKEVRKLNNAEEKLGL